MPAEPPPPRPWRREDGRYRSADDRFTIEGGGAGRWYLTDGESLDELGLTRTLGPYDTLDAAKAAATDRRGRVAEASPLAAVIAAAKDRPSRTTRAPQATGQADDGPAPPAPEPDPPPRTWLDELADEDGPAAAQARRMIDQLSALGVRDPDGVVRRDVLGRQPAVATSVLGHALADALRGALEQAAMDRDAHPTNPEVARRLVTGDEATSAAYAAVVASRVLAATLEVLAGQDRADGAGPDLPGWRLVERPAAQAGDDAPRRLIVTPEDVPRR